VNLNIRYTFGYKTFFNHFLLIYAQQIKVKLAAINIKFHYISAYTPFYFSANNSFKKNFHSLQNVCLIFNSCWSEGKEKTKEGLKEFNLNITVKFHTYV